MSTEHQASVQHVHKKESNGLGMAGFIVSLVGLVVTCGILCPIGFLMSLFALFKKPRGMAIAGTIIGGLGSLGIVIAFAAFGTAIFGLVGLSQELAKNAETNQVLMEGVAIIEDHEFENNQLPSGVEGNKLLVEAGLTDAWEREIRYDPAGDSFLIRSAGSDGEWETGDDLTRGPAAQPDPDDIKFDASPPEIEGLELPPLDAAPGTPTDGPPLGPS